MRTQVALDAIDPLVNGTHENPFEILGPHQVSDKGRSATAVRAFLPDSQQAWVVDSAHGVSRPMRRIHPAGLFEAICPATQNEDHYLTAGNYQLRVNESNGEQRTMHDPYAFQPLMTEYDLHLFAEGNHWEIHQRLGAQIRTINGVQGINFAVWAPNAESVAIIGDFNGWDTRRHPMRKHIPAGIWELFIPNLSEGALYKFSVKQPGGHIVEKSDPFGFAAELPPRTASIVTDLNKHQWQDDAWMKKREKNNALDAPISIYEVHLGSWQRDPEDPTRWLSYRELAPKLVEYCQKMGYTHLELMPVSEHPYTPSWGYQTVGYFAATSRYGTPEDLMFFVDYCHQNNLGVMIDWVPAHFPKDNHGLRQFDGSALFEHADPRQGEHPDWGTLIFNYGRNEIKNFLISNALFWLEYYHIDGLRVDAVASMLYLDYSREEGEWVPNKHGGRENLEAIEFIKQFNEEIHAQHPNVLTIAEESTSWSGVSKPTYLGGLGFSMKWNMGWMNDTLAYMKHDPIHRSYHHDELTFSLIYAFTENFCLPLSHDEVVHGKKTLLDQMPGDFWQRFANLRLLYSYMWTHPGKKLTFMGGELGQWLEWDCDTSLQWDLLQWDTHKGIQNCVADLNSLYQREPALHEVDFDAQGFEWIDCHNHTDSILCYIRKAKDPKDYLIVCCNFTPSPHENYRLGVPEEVWFQEIYNSDSNHYNGSNMGNNGGIMATNTPSHNRPASIQLTLPPLGVTILKPHRS